MNTNFSFPGKNGTPATPEELFETIIKKASETIRQNKERLEAGNTTDEELRDWFKSLMEELYMQMDSVSQEFFIKPFIQTTIVMDYFCRLESIKRNILRLAMHSAADKIYVWAEINDKDEKTEYELMAIEATINSIFSEASHMILETMIVEKGEGLRMPAHYKKVL